MFVLSKTCEFRFTLIIYMHLAPPIFLKSTKFQTNTRLLEKEMSFELSTPTKSTSVAAFRRVLEKSLKFKKKL